MKAFKLIKLVGSLAAAGSLLGYGAASFAAPSCPETGDPQANYKCVFIDTGVDNSPENLLDTDSKTGNFYELGLTGTLATSIYESGLADGSQIIDTNIQSILNNYGIVGNSTYTSASNIPNSVALKDAPSLFSELNVDNLNPLDPTFGDREGFNTIGGWILYFDYYLSGTLSTTTGPSYNDGYFNFYYKNLNTNPGLSRTGEVQVLRVNVTGSVLNVANLDVLGEVSFDFDGNGTNDCTTSLCQNFWNFQTGNQRWYDINPVSTPVISFNLDSNVNPPIPTLDSLGVTTVDGNEYWTRQTTLDSSMRFNTVPEPGSLALLGLGLAGLGFGSLRRRRQVV